MRREQAERRERGDTKQLGVGFSTYIEMCGLAPSRVLGALKYVAGGWEAATIRCLPTGTVQVLTGTTPHGQGHDTTFSQIVADRLGVDFDDVEVLHGDTSIVPLGHGHLRQPQPRGRGRRALRRDEKVVAKARTIAAHTLEVAEDDLEYDGGTFRVKGTDRSMTVKELAFAAWTPTTCRTGSSRGSRRRRSTTRPILAGRRGPHRVVEVDTETGAADLVRYVAVDDWGR